MLDSWSNTAKSQSGAPGDCLLGMPQGGDPSKVGPSILYLNDANQFSVGYHSGITSAGGSGVCSSLLLKTVAHAEGTKLTKSNETDMSKGGSNWCYFMSRCI